MDMYGIYLDSSIFSLMALLHVKNDETATTTQNSHVQMTTKAENMLSPIKKHVLLSGFIFQVYISWILANLRYCRSDLRYRIIPM